MKKLSQLLKMLDENILKVSLLFFVFLIPLYPKLPLFGVGYTYIAIRFDDFLAVFVSIIFLIQLLRHKVTINKKFLILTLLFWAAVFASFYYNVFVIKNMPYRQVAFLHALRRVEYMMVFFVAISAIKSKKDFSQLLHGLVVSSTFVIAYALGQKFFGFPAVQTMNPAFSQGQILLLTPEARISGTFGGHYDLAAYLVFLIPILFGYFFTKSKFVLKRSEKYFVYIISLVVMVYTAFNFRVTNEWIIIAGLLVPLLLLYVANTTLKEKIVVFIFIIGAIAVLIFTASRISFGAYVITTPIFLLFIRRFRYAIFIIGITVLLFFTSKDLSNRFSKTFQVKQILVNEKTGQVFIPQVITSKELPAGSAYYGLKNNKPATTATEKYKQRIINETIANPNLSKKQKADLIASLGANIQPVSSVVTDISFATRLQIEWPRALTAFMKNPILGTGPFSITEATDNDFLRWLGEFGLAGFGTFMALLGYFAWTVFSYAKRQEKDVRPLYYGVLFGLGGLLFNAGYIDVFEASKVAYIFWYTAGIYIGLISLKHD